MNALLLLAIIAWCDRLTDRDTCVRQTLECAATAGAYDKTEKQATRIVADCVLPKKGKP